MFYRIEVCGCAGVSCAVEIVDVHAQTVGRLVHNQHSTDNKYFCPNPNPADEDGVEIFLVGAD